MSIMKAIAEVTAGTSYAGPLALLAGATVGAALFAYAASMGISGMGSSIGTSIPSSIGNDSISPMNQSVATAKANAYNSQRTEDSPKVFVNITDNSRFDPLGANQVRDLQYSIVSSDGKTGGLGQ